MAPQNKTLWYDPKIYNNTAKVSRDHYPIGITLNLIMRRPRTKKPIFIKTKKMMIKDVDEEIILKIGEVAQKEITNKEEWKEILNTAEKDIDLEKLHQEYNNLI